MPHVVVLGLGTNLEPRLKTIAAAIQLLLSEGILRHPKVAELVESEALLLEGSPDTWRLPFYNTAVSGETSLAPLDLLHSIKKIEVELGRKVRGRWAPREIDIDILAYGAERFSADNLTIPHLALQERPFAWWPLLAVAPETPIPTPSGGTAAATIGLIWHGNRNEIPCRTARATHSVQRTFSSLLPKATLPLCPAPLPSTELVGILNITPDSFSDGGKHCDPSAAKAQARAMFDAGATVLDIGGESTRPGAAVVTPTEEWARIKPVLDLVRSEFANDSLKPQISIDTRRAEVAEKALNYGVNWINDVSGFSDPAMVALARANQFELVVMHSLGIPPRKDTVMPQWPPAIAQLSHWAASTLSALEQAGIPSSRVILDPGIGFGKTAEQSWQLISVIDKLRTLGARVLVGHSRKSFLNVVTDREFAARDPETAAISAMLSSRKVEYLRVHNVGLNARAIHAATSTTNSPS